MKTNFSLKTKNLLFILLMLPIIGFGQVKNVISTQRIFPKVDKVMEFEKALAAHAQKYHTGEHHWRVFQIQSGPDAGGYHITEGPTSWAAEDTRGDLGAEHMMDWHKNVAIHLTDRSSAGYSVYQDSLSTVALGAFTEKIQITHIYPKLGKDYKVEQMLKELRKAWKADNITMAVYASNASGPGQYTLTRRFQQGLKEKAVGYRKPFKGTYESVNGEGSWEEYLDNASEYINDSWSELLFMRKDLSSK